MTEKDKIWKLLISILAICAFLLAVGNEKDIVKENLEMKDSIQVLRLDLVYAMKKIEIIEMKFEGLKWVK